MTSQSRPTPQHFHRHDVLHIATVVPYGTSRDADSKRLFFQQRHFETDYAGVGRACEIRTAAEIRTPPQRKGPRFSVRAISLAMIHRGSWIVAWGESAATP